jgi:hypothetical protein
MSVTFGLLMILSGLAILSFGLFLFYAWLPVLYAFVGFDIGLLIGRTLFGDGGVIVLLFGFGGALVLGGASYFLEPYRRLLIGAAGGVLFGLSVPGAIGIDGWFGGLFSRVLALVCGVIGAFIVPLFFDIFVISITAVSGAAIAMIGAHHILPDAGWFDRGVLPALLTLILAVAGGTWQYRNIENWIRMVPTGRDDPASSVGTPNGSPRP